MKLFESNIQAVEASTEVLSTFPMLYRLVDKNDLAGFWLKYLIDKSIRADEIRTTNLFSISMAVAYARAHNISSPYVALYEGFLSSLERVTTLLSESTNLDSFRFKLRNPEGTQTISCFSELFLAEHFHRKGFSVGFEFPFKLQLDGKTIGRGDFDLVIEVDNKHYFVEVYTPVCTLNPTTDEAYFGIDGEDYPEFLDRISHKAANKFGFGTGATIIAPSFPKVLAVNARYFDAISFDLALGLTTHKLVKDLRSLFSQAFPLDAVLIFQTNDTIPTMPIHIHYFETNPQTAALKSTPAR